LSYVILEGANMNLHDDLKDNESFRHSSESETQHPLEHETIKTGQRQGGLDKKGEKEKDKKGDF
jgi:hypothetical protein